MANGVIITVSRAEYHDQTPEEVLAWHVGQRAWWSSSRHDDTLLNGQRVFVRFAGSSEIIARAHVTNDEPQDEPCPGEPDPRWRYGIEFLDSQPIRGVYLRDFDIGFPRSRRGLIPLSDEETQAIDEALDHEASA